ncbi:MAG: 50S ribosomal protein L23 [Candidatus Krumholzibacteria bacterium]|nr:50S ribosomal protein L23 [Candidatus Krumholzibacteria bacterium]MDP7022072.1 50S ribosomal protein L23 [Candidatus Krumholzibacteria bacterium]
MKDLHRIVRRVLQTEKSSQLIAENKYVFEVDSRAGKPEVKKAVETLFGVTVEEVRTMNVRGKVKRMGRFSGKRPDWKKAVVTLAEGNTIDLVGEI